MVRDLDRDLAPEASVRLSAAHQVGEIAARTKRESIDQTPGGWKGLGSAGEKQAGIRPID
jgi:hypothetical protein